jgi:hypothetical protein
LLLPLLLLLLLLLLLQLLLPLLLPLSLPALLVVISQRSEESAFVVVLASVAIQNLPSPSPPTFFFKFSPEIACQVQKPLNLSNKTRSQVANSPSPFAILKLGEKYSGHR